MTDFFTQERMLVPHGEWQLKVQPYNLSSLISESNVADPLSDKIAGIWHGYATNNLTVGIAPDGQWCSSQIVRGKWPWALRSRAIMSGPFTTETEAENSMFSLVSTGSLYEILFLTTNNSPNIDTGTATFTVPGWYVVGVFGGPWLTPFPYNPGNIYCDYAVNLHQRTTSVNVVAATLFQIGFAIFDDVSNPRVPMEVTLLLGWRGPATSDYVLNTWVYANYGTYTNATYRYSQLGRDQWNYIGGVNLKSLLVSACQFYGFINPIVTGSYALVSVNDESADMYMAWMRVRDT